MTLKLLEGRSPVTDLEDTIKKLKSDIKFYERRPLFSVDIEDAKKKLQEYEDAIEKLKDKHEG